MPRNSEEHRLFLEHFAFAPHALVNVVGGGGKTALIHRLMEECCPRGTVLYTTTTRIHPPHPGEGTAVISSDNLSLLKLLIDGIVHKRSDKFYGLIVTRHYMSPTLLRGVPPDFAGMLDREDFSLLLNEGDGAAGFSIKLPREGEPVLMENAEYLIPVIGLDCLDQPMGPESIFRWKESADRFALPRAGRITPEIAARLLMHPQGVCRGCSPGTEIIPFINKVDSPAQDAAAKELALSILRNGSFPVRRVVAGSLFHGRIDSIS